MPMRDLETKFARLPCRRPWARQRGMPTRWACISCDGHSPYRRARKGRSVTSNYSNARRSGYHRHRGGRICLQGRPGPPPSSSNQLGRGRPAGHIRPRVSAMVVHHAGKLLSPCWLGAGADSGRASREVDQAASPTRAFPARYGEGALLPCAQANAEDPTMWSRSCFDQCVYALRHKELRRQARLIGPGYDPDEAPAFGHCR